MSKCSDCQHCKYEGASLDYPYPSAYCLKGNWDGIGSTEELEGEIECDEFKEILVSDGSDLRALKLVRGHRDHLLVGKRGGSGYWVEKVNNKEIVLKKRYSRSRKTFCSIEEYIHFSNKNELCFVKIS